MSDGAFFELFADDQHGRRARPRAPRPRRAAVLEGERVRLRPFVESDAAPLAAMMRHADFGRSADPDADQESARRWLERNHETELRGSALRWTVAQPGDDRPVGYLTAFRLDDGFHRDGCEIGYRLEPGVRGQGLAREAVRLFLTHAFADVADGGLGLRRVRAITSPENLASRAVLRANGFRLWGIEPDAVAPGSFGGQRTDHQGDAPSPDRLQLALTRDQWAAQADRPDVPTLEGDGVRLREWRHTDADRVREACSDPRSRHWLAGLPDPYTLAHAGAFIARAADRSAAGDDVCWCVADPDTDECVGALTVHRVSTGRPAGPSVGYWAHPKSRGRGVMTAALRLAAQHCLTDAESGGLGLPRLSLVAADGNRASQHVARSAGFRRGGLDRASVLLGDGTVADRVRFDLLPRDRTAGEPDGDRGLEPVTVEGRDVRLREWRDDDVPRIVEACTDPTTRHWLATLPDPYDAEAGRGYVEMTRGRHRDGAGLFWCAADPGADVCLGSLGLMDLAGEDPTSAEVGYWLHPDARGRGVMREAVGLAVRHAFLPLEDGGLGLRRLRLNVAAGNEASARIASGHGFTEVGRDRLAERLGDGSYVDLRRFDLLATEWAGRGSGPHWRPSAPGASPHASPGRQPPDSGRGTAGE